MTESSNNLHKKGTTPDSLDGPEGNGSGEYIDKGEDEGDEERVRDGTSGLEERGRIVKDKVDTRPLLHHLERSTENGATDIATSLPERAREAMEPAGPVTSDRDCLAFILSIGDNLCKFRSDVLRVFGLTAKSSEHGTSAVNLFFLDKVTGRFGEEVEASTEDKTPSKLEADWDTIRPRICPFLGGVSDTRREKQTKGDTCAKNNSMVGHS